MARKSAVSDLERPVCCDDEDADEADDVEELAAEEDEKEEEEEEEETEDAAVVSTAAVPGEDAAEADDGTDDALSVAVALIEGDDDSVRDTSAAADGTPRGDGGARAPSIEALIPLLLGDEEEPVQSVEPSRRIGLVENCMMVAVLVVLRSEINKNQ